MATETWVLNSSLSGVNGAGKTYNCSFVSNGVNYSSIQLDPDKAYEDELRYDSTTVYYYNWNNQVYRTITFATAPTGDLLTWLEANGVKQGGGTTMINIDLTTLSGYESLSAGTYALSVKAKAANYQDSDLSSTVSFTKLAAPVATASDTTVTWEAVANAESYDVYVDGELYENTTGGGNV